MRRSALRHTVRHTWHCAAAWHPPGSTKLLSVGSDEFMLSIWCSSSSTSALSSRAEGYMGVCDVSVARKVQALNMSHCMRSSVFITAASASALLIIAASSPMCEDSSSIVPYASRRAESFGVRCPPTSDVRPSSPVRV